MYWSAIKDGHEGIMSSRIDGTGQEYLLQDDSLSMIEDISVDYLGQNIYFTESKKRFIGVVGIRSKGYAYLFEEKVDKPRAIVVYPEKALLFYTDWGESPAVVRAHMDGSERESIVVTNLKWPNGITVDIAHDRIYWSDAMFNTLESSKMDGSDRRTVVETIAKHPFSLAVFEDTLYWSDWQSREIQSCNKYTGKNLTTLVKEAKVVPYGLFIYHPLLEPFSSNPCANNFCSHLCLLAPRGNYACYCPGNMTLGRDRLTCEAQLPPSPPPPPPPRTGGKDAEDSIDPRAITNGVTRLSSTTPKPQNPRIFPLDNSGDEARTFAEEGRRPPVTTEKQTPTPTPRTSSVIPPIRSSSEVPENSAAVYDKDWAKKTPIDESGSDVEGLIVGLIVLFAIVLLIAVAIFYFIRRR